MLIWNCCSRCIRISILISTLFYFWSDSLMWITSEGLSRWHLSSTCRDPIQAQLIFRWNPIPLWTTSDMILFTYAYKINRCKGVSLSLIHSTPWRTQFCSHYECGLLPAIHKKEASIADVHLLTLKFDMYCGNIVYSRCLKVNSYRVSFQPNMWIGEQKNWELLRIEKHFNS